jgi:hypothetical protein
VQYAYADAVCDHAGGESVYGEFFNVALQSAAFVISDRRKLVDIALSYIPPECKTAAAVRAAVGAHESGADWLTARRAVMDAAPHYVAQYSPVNIGFQIVGLLYGTDMGDAIVLTVNCGYDTDSSGAATGSYFGIIDGMSGLPKRWTDPLGDTIATNESWSGVKHLSDGPNPVPTTLGELTERIRTTAKRFLRAHGVLTDTTNVLSVDEADLYADESVFALYRRSPTEVNYPGRDLDVVIDYGPGPSVLPGQERTVATRIRNNRRDPVTVTATLVPPPGWTAIAAQSAEVAVDDEVSLTWTVPAAEAEIVNNANRFQLDLVAADLPAQPSVPVVLVGARPYRVSGPYPLDGATDADALSAAGRPESADDANRPGEWTDVIALGDEIPVGDRAGAEGVYYVQGYFDVPEPVATRVTVDANVPVRFWVNGVDGGTELGRQGVRPSYHGWKGTLVDLELPAGWVEVLIKLVRRADDPPIECYLTCASADRLEAGQTQIGRTRLPEAGAATTPVR